MNAAEEHLCREAFSDLKSKLSNVYKEDVVHIHNAILLSHIKECSDAICSNMNGPRDYHTK